MKVVILLLMVTSCYTLTNAVRRKTEIQRKFLDGLVRLVTKESFPPLFEEIKRYFKSKDVLRKLITDIVIWKSEKIKRVFRIVRNKVDAVESVLWILFKTKSKPKGRPNWEWLDSNYEWTKKGRRGTSNPDGNGNQDYNNNNNNDNDNGDYNNNGGDNNW